MGEPAPEQPPKPSVGVLDPIKLCNQVRDRYLSYLETTFYFRDPELRQSFRKALREGSLAAGPFVEWSRVFERTLSPSELFPELLGTDPEAGFLQALSGARRLYWHQEQAIRLTSAGKNVIVATGTGSGKTEAFLYPILLDLYKEAQLGAPRQPGVRALILYPMNALAYDQRDRLGAIAARLKAANAAFSFTFGQYIGDTPEDEHDSYRSAKRQLSERLPGELILRREMRDTPPDILLTNYSMLEYLLLRPADCPLFDRSTDTWRFLVVDEAHQYRGSRGNEMAMLLRRLKSRLRGSGSGLPFRCIATSATLASSEQDREVVTEFASDLFGEPFGPDSLILAKTVAVPPTGSKRLPAWAYATLREALEGERPASAAIVDIAALVGAEVQEGDDIKKAVYRILAMDQRIEELRYASAASLPQTVTETASQCFPELDGQEAASTLACLLELAVRVQDPATGDPALSARYHYFLRSLEGAFISLYPERSVRLSRPGASEGRHWFEVALCRQCGQHYIVGKNEKGYLCEANRDPSDPDAEAVFYRPVDPAADGLDEAEELNDVPRKARLFRLCTQCGAIWPESRGKAGACGHGNTIVVEEQQNREGLDQIPKCTACGIPGPDPVREVVHGTDGPHAVIATTLCEELPEPRRRILAFADSRQEAAFFPWYLEDSYRAIRTRSLLLRALREMGPFSMDGVSMRDLARALAKLYSELRVYPATMSALDLARQAWVDVYREFLTDQPRLSLEGVGLVAWDCRWLLHAKPPAFLLAHPWNMSLEQAAGLVQVLLSMTRNDGAFELRTQPGVTTSWADLNLIGPPKRIRLGRPGKQTGVSSWDGPQGRRVQYIVKTLRRLGFAEASAEAGEEVARAILAYLKEQDSTLSAGERLLIPFGDGLKMNPEWWRIRLLAPGEPLWRCATCGQVQSGAPTGVCARHRCTGTLIPCTAETLDDDHYRMLYSSLSGVRLRAEEHTAQIDRERARELQREFKAGDIDLLSSSTTFELGVDLGELDVVFLRNVPPEPFNYAQRVGRAGRRRGAPGVAITYCRRSPHDLYHFWSPARMIRGISGLPGLTLRNVQIARRHLAATVLAHFLRSNPDRFESVDAFCGNLERPTILGALGSHARQHRAELERTMTSMVREDLWGPLGLPDGSWLEQLCGQRTRLADVVASVSSDYRRLGVLERESSQNRSYDKAKWARGRAQQIAGEDVISFLSRSAVIPKYGFPVDVVELDIQKTNADPAAKDVMLQRDLSLAVAEFAPTCEVVANKKVWRSIGIKTMPERPLARYTYKVCTQHDGFVAWKADEQDEPALPCGCGGQRCGEFLSPRFGFIASGTPKDPVRRPARMFTTRPRFLGLVRPADQIGRAHGPVRFFPTSPGQMAVVCEGRRGLGFLICTRCGAGFSTLSAEIADGHEDPYGKPCDGTLRRMALGHVFTTDVLRFDFPLPPFPDEDQDGGTLWFAHSLAYSLLEGAAQTLDVPATDISVTVQCREPGAMPGVILYDNVPGGAGLVARLEDSETFRESLIAAHTRVAGACGCDEDTSCYGCLRSYRNQYAHPHLRRGPVARYLTWILDGWPGSSP